jgi:hypothetical protein
MQELIARATDATGLDAARAEKAIGILLNLLKTQGDQTKMVEFLARLPGAEALITAHGRDGAGAGGLLGMLGGGAMGGPLAAMAKLQAAGLNTDQMKALGKTVLAYAKEKAGEDLVRQVAGSIPGLSGFV